MKKIRKLTEAGKIPGIGKLTALRKTAGLLINILCGVIAVFSLGVLLLTLFGIRPYVVLSGSMEPEIPTGSICFVDTNAAYETVSEGDIIAFEFATGMMVTHRVVSVTDDGLVTKGDANDNQDGVTTTAANFKGKNIFHIPYIGYLTAFVCRGYVRALILIGCVFTALLMLLISCIRDYRTGRPAVLTKNAAETAASPKGRKI